MLAHAVHVPRPPDDPDGLRPPRRHLLHAPGMMISVCEKDSDKMYSKKDWFSLEKVHWANGNAGRRLSLFVFQIESSLPENVHWHFGCGISRRTKERTQNWL